MRRAESKFASPEIAAAAVRLGSAIRTARLARNITQQTMAERARMSTLTWLKIEKGDVSVAMGSWLSALERVGLLALLAEISRPDADRLGEALRREQARVRARPSANATRDYDF